MGTRKTVNDCWIKSEITEERVTNLTKRFDEFQKDIKMDIHLLTDMVNEGFKSINDKQIDLFNHQSSRLPVEYVDQLTQEKEQHGKEKAIRWSAISAVLVSIVTAIVIKLIG